MMPNMAPLSLALLFFFILDLCRQGDTGPHSYTGRVAVAQKTTHMKLSFLLVSLLVLQLSRLQ